MNCIFEGYILEEFKTDIFSVILFAAILLMAGLSSIEFEERWYLFWGLSLFIFGALEYSVFVYFSKLYFNNLIQKYLKNVDKKEHIK
jgi:hypothetical protein